MKEKKNKPLVRYDPSSDVLYIATRKGVEEEFTEVAPGVMRGRAGEPSRRGAADGVAPVLVDDRHGLAGLRTTRIQQYRQ